MELTTLQQTLSFFRTSGQEYPKLMGSLSFNPTFIPQCLPSSILRSDPYLARILKPNVTSEFHPCLLDVSNSLKMGDLLSPS